MDYREFPVPPSLRRHVACVWYLRDEAPVAEVQTIYPDGCCELIVHLGPSMRACDAEHGWHIQAALLFAAQQRGAVRLSAQARVHCLGVRLHQLSERLAALEQDIAEHGSQPAIVRRVDHRIEQLDLAIAAHHTTRIFG